MAFVVFYVHAAHGAVEPAHEFWASRKARAEQLRDNASPRSALPGDSSAGSPVLLAQLPSIDLGFTSDALPKPRIAVPDFNAFVQPAALPALSRRIPKPVQSIPMSRASLRDVYLPPGWKPGDLMVVHVQDAHANAEAQSNIAQIIEKIGTAPIIVGIEGARGPLDFSPYRSFPDANAAKETAGYLMKESFITGPEYAGMTMAADRSLSFWGIEREDLYLENVRALTESAAHQKEARQKIGTLSALLDRVKERKLNPALREVDAKIAAHRRQETGLGEYLRFMTRAAGRSATGESARLFLDALALEESLNYEKVNEERKALTNALARKLSKHELKNLMDASLSYRVGNLTHGAFYRYLSNLCRASGVSLADWPEMDKYIRYVLISERIAPERLMEEVETLERDAVRANMKTAEEKEIVALAGDLALAEKLAGYALNPREWKAYEARRAEMVDISGRLAKQTGAASENLAEILARFERFHRAAAARDAALVENFLSRVRAESGAERRSEDHVAVLVAGGFHTEGITEILRGRKIAYAVLTPRLGKVEGAGAEYLELFSRDRTPLEKLFSGERLTLAPQSPFAETMGGDPLPSAGLVEKLFPALAATVRIRNELQSLARVDPAFANDEVRKVISDELNRWVRSNRFRSLKSIELVSILPKLDESGAALEGQFSASFAVEGEKADGPGGARVPFRANVTLDVLPRSEAASVPQESGIRAEIGESVIAIRESQPGGWNLAKRFFASLSTRMLGRARQFFRAAVQGVKTGLLTPAMLAVGAMPGSFSGQPQKKLKENDLRKLAPDRPAVPLDARNFFEMPGMSTAIERLASALGRPDSRLNRTIAEAQQQKPGQMPFDQHTEFLRRLGKKAAVRGPSVYYPHGGFDSYSPFTVVADATDVFATGKDHFGAAGRFRRVFGILRDGGRKSAWDHTYDVENLYKDLTDPGTLAIARIMAYLKGTVTGLYYFEMEKDGSLKFLKSGEAWEGTDLSLEENLPGNAVIEFTGADGTPKRYWYIRHNSLTDDPVFQGFADHLKFQTLFIKAPMSPWDVSTPGRKNAIRNMLTPAKRNNARILTDDAGDILIHPIWKVGSPPRRIALEPGEEFGYSNLTDDSCVFVGDGRDLIDPDTPNNEVIWTYSGLGDNNEARERVWSNPSRRIASSVRELSWGAVNDARGALREALLAEPSRANLGDPLLTPLVTMPGLSRAASRAIGRDVTVLSKAEFTLPRGAFKFRAQAKVFTLLREMSADARSRMRALITASTGNHGLNTAYAAQLARRLYPEMAGLRARILTAPGINPAKRAAILAESADLVTQDRAGRDLADYDAANAEAFRLEKEDGNNPTPALIHVPHGDPRVIAGYASAGLEIYEQLVERGLADKKIAVVIPAGSGGFSAGIAWALRKISEDIKIRNELAAQGKTLDIKIITSQTQDVTGLHDSLLAGRAVRREITAVRAADVDGIGVGTPEPLAVDILLRLADHSVIVDGDAVVAKTAEALADYRRSKDPAVRAARVEATAGLAALVPETYPELFSDRDVIIEVATGGNVNDELWSRITRARAPPAKRFFAALRKGVSMLDRFVRRYVTVFESPEKKLNENESRKLAREAVIRMVSLYNDNANPIEKTDREGDVLSGDNGYKFKILSKIGEGRRSEIYLAEVVRADGPAGLAPGAKVAIKQYLPDVHNDLYEAEIANLDRNRGNPRAAQMYDSNSSARFIAMEYVDGISFEQLYEAAKEEGGVSNENAADTLRIVKEIARAYLDTYKNFQTADMDAHPGNVILGADGRVVLVDMQDPESSTWRTTSKKTLRVLLDSVIPAGNGESGRKIAEILGALKKDLYNMAASDSEPQEEAFERVEQAIEQIEKVIPPAPAAIPDMYPMLKKVMRNLTVDSYIRTWAPIVETALFGILYYVSLFTGLFIAAEFLDSYSSAVLKAGFLLAVIHYWVFVAAFSRMHDRVYHYHQKVKGWHLTSTTPKDLRGLKFAAFFLHAQILISSLLFLTLLLNPLNAPMYAITGSILSALGIGVSMMLHRSYNDRVRETGRPALALGTDELMVAPDGLGEQDDPKFTEHMAREFGEREFTPKQRTVFAYLYFLGARRLAYIFETGKPAFGLSLDDNLVPTVNYLKSVGVTRIGHIIDVFPETLAYSLNDNLKPTVQYLQSIGVKVGPLIDFYPSVLGLSLENNLKPTINFLKGLGVARIGRVIGLDPLLLGMNVERKLKPTADYLKSLGVKRLGHVIDIFPQILGYSLEDKIKPAVEYLRENGLDPADVIDSYPAILGYSLENKLKPSMRLLRRIYPRGSVDLAELQKLLMLNIDSLEIIYEKNPLAIESVADLRNVYEQTERRVRKGSGVSLSRLRRESPEELAYVIDEILTRVPARWLLSGLGLGGAESLPASAGPGGVMTIKISARPRGDPDALPREGIETLQYHFKADDFEAVLGEGGRILAVFPAGPDAAEYFDLSPYYFDMPEYSDPRLNEAWDRFRDSLALDAAVIRRYMDARFGRDAGKIRRVGYDGETVFHNDMPYHYVEISGNGKYSVKAVDPSKTDRLEPFDPKKKQALLPVFPTVYGPGADLNEVLDTPYMEAVYRQTHPGQNVLIVGPGSGVDAWIAALKSRRKVFAAGINPLEVANVRAAAAVARFEVEAKLSDNIVTSVGEPVFGDRRFDRVIWNGVLVTNDSRPAGTMIQRWDGDEGGKTLRRFAAALPAALSPGGLAIFWNGPDPRVRQLFETPGRQMSVEREGGVYLIRHLAAPSVPGGAFNALKIPEVGAGVRRLSAELRNKNTAPGAALETLRRGTADLLPLNAYGDFLRSLGVKAKVRGPAVYYPFSGFDPYTPFTVVPGATDVFAMGKERFGSAAEIARFLEIAPAAHKAGRQYGSYDVLWGNSYTVDDLETHVQAVVGSVAIPRVLAFLEARIEGIYFFRVRRDGTLRFMTGADPDGGNAVIEFRDKEGTRKRYWYFRHDVARGSAPEIQGFRRFIGRLRFQTLFIKAPMSPWNTDADARDRAIREALVPARKNGARVISDESVAGYNQPHPIWRSDYKPEAIALNHGETFGYASYPAGGGMVFAGTANGLITTRTPPGSIKDDWAEKRFGADSTAYKRYTIFGVNWEAVFSVPSVIFAALGGALPHLMLINLASAFVFSGAHKGRSVGARAKLVIVGFILSLASITPLVFFSLFAHIPLINQLPAEVYASIEGLLLNMILHSGYNALALRFGWPAASVRVLKRPRQPVRYRTFVITPAVRNRVAMHLPERLTMPADPAYKPDERTLEIFKGLSEGRKITDIAAQLNTNPLTFRDQLYRLYKRLGVKDRDEAVLHAVMQGWITRIRFQTRPRSKRRLSYLTGYQQDKLIKLARGLSRKQAEADHHFFQTLYAQLEIKGTEGISLLPLAILIGLGEVSERDRMLKGILREETWAEIGRSIGRKTDSLPNLANETLYPSLGLSVSAMEGKSKAARAALELGMPIETPIPPAWVAKPWLSENQWKIFETLGRSPDTFANIADAMGIQRLRTVNDQVGRIALRLKERGIPVKDIRIAAVKMWHVQKSMLSRAEQRILEGAVGSGFPVSFKPGDMGKISKYDMLVQSSVRGVSWLLRSDDGKDFTLWLPLQIAFGDGAGTVWIEAGRGVLNGDFHWVPSRPLDTVPQGIWKRQLHELGLGLKDFQNIRKGINVAGKLEMAPEPPAAMPRLYPVLKKFMPNLTLNSYIRTWAPVAESGTFGVLYLFAVFVQAAALSALGLDLNSSAFLPHLIPFFGSVLIYGVMNFAFGMMHTTVYRFDADKKAWSPLPASVQVRFSLAHTAARLIHLNYLAGLIALTPLFVIAGYFSAPAVLAALFVMGVMGISSVAVHGLYNVFAKSLDLPALAIGENTFTDGPPAAYLLESLALNDLDLSGAVGRPDGTKVLRVSASPRLDPNALPQRGLETLQYHFKTDAFDLLLSGDNRILAIFPASDYPEVKEYFDISPYYFDARRHAGADLQSKWDEFIQNLAKDAALIETYKRARYGWRADQIVRQGEDDGRFIPYLSVEAVRGGGVRVQRVGPGMGDPLPYNPDNPQVLIPVFPTVYNPGHGVLTLVDRPYHAALYRELGPGESVMIAGPGTGLDSWLSWLKTGEKIYSVGINPLEIANLRATAAIAGFEVEARVHDNIISEDGTPAFGDRRFDWINWNGVEYTEKEVVPVNMTDRFDKDYGGTVLRRFARGLDVLLKPGGRSLFWNERSPAVRRILASAGRDEENARILDVRPYENLRWGTVYSITKPADSLAPTVPAKWILGALKIDHLNLSGAVKGPGGARIVRISAKPRLNPRELPQGGLDVLQHHFNDDAFEAVLAEDGRVLAIFPTGEDAEDAEEYFDLSPYYFDVPRYSDPDFNAKWERLRESMRRDREVIDRYMQARFGKNARDVRSTGYDRFIPANGTPYAYAEISADGDYTASPFDPMRGDIPVYDPAKRQIILPVFPTVFNPGVPGEMSSEGIYMKSIYERLQPGQSVLIAGPGSGVDSWVSWLRTGGMIRAVGINPLEVANVKATAAIAGFKVSAKVHDNIISEDGTPAFGDMQFDWINWNGVEYDIRKITPANMTERWDGDTGGVILRRFAAGLYRMLKPGGRSVHWNARHAAVRKILETAGQYDDRPGRANPALLKVERESVFGRVYYIAKPARSAESQIPPDAHNLLQNTSLGRALQSLARDVRDPDNPVGRETVRIKRGGLDHLPLEQHQAFMSRLGESAQIRGPVVYYPLSGFDPYSPFAVSPESTDVFAVAKDVFGRPGELLEFIRKQSPDVKAGGQYATFDQSEIRSGLLFDRTKTGGLGMLAVARILSFLNGDIEGIYYFTIDSNGAIRYVDRDGPGYGVNAVIEFRDGSGALKRYWHIRHDFNVPEDGFSKFINAIKFQTLFIKAANMELAAGNAAMEVLAPAKRNRARVLRDHDRFATLGEEHVPIWKPGYEPAVIKLNGLETIGYSDRSKPVHAGDAEGLAGNPAIPSGAFNAFNLPHFKDEVFWLARQIKNDQSDIGKMLKGVKRGTTGTLPFDEHTRFLNELGRKARLRGPAVYYPFGGFDPYNPFSVVEDATDVFAMGLYGFGSVKDTVANLKTAAYVELSSGYNSFDTMTNYSLMTSVNGVNTSIMVDLRTMGSLTISRIMAYLGGTIKGLYYFDIAADGSLRFLNDGEIGEGDSAVVEFEEAGGRVRRYWYLRHDVNTLDPAYTAFMDRLAFQTLFIKAPMQPWNSAQVNRIRAIQDTLAPAKRNGARVITDGQLTRTVAQHPIWLPGQRPEEIALGPSEIFGYSSSYPSRGVVFAGDAAQLIDANTPTSDIVGFNTNDENASGALKGPNISGLAGFILPIAFLALGAFYDSTFFLMAPLLAMISSPEPINISGISGNPGKRKEVREFLLSRLKALRKEFPQIPKDDGRLTSIVEQVLKIVSAPKFSSADLSRVDVKGMGSANGLWPQLLTISAETPARRAGAVERSAVPDTAALPLPRILSGADLNRNANGMVRTVREQFHAGEPPALSPEDAMRFRQLLQEYYGEWRLVHFLTGAMGDTTLQTSFATVHHFLFGPASKRILSNDLLHKSGQAPFGWGYDNGYIPNEREFAYAFFTPEDDFDRHFRDVTQPSAGAVVLSPQALEERNVSALNILDAQEVPLRWMGNRYTRFLPPRITRAYWQSEFLSMSGLLRVREELALLELGRHRSFYPKFFHSAHAVIAHAADESLIEKIVLPINVYRAVEREIKTRFGGNYTIAGRPWRDVIVEERDYFKNDSRLARLREKRNALASFVQRFSPAEAESIRAGEAMPAVTKAQTMENARFLLTDPRVTQNPVNFPRSENLFKNPAEELRRIVSQVQAAGDTSIEMFSTVLKLSVPIGGRTDVVPNPSGDGCIVQLTGPSGRVGYFAVSGRGAVSPLPDAEGAAAFALDASLEPDQGGVMRWVKAPVAAMLRKSGMSERGASLTYNLGIAFWLENALVWGLSAVLIAAGMDLAEANPISWGAFFGVHLGEYLILKLTGSPRAPPMNQFLAQTALPAALISVTGIGFSSFLLMAAVHFTVNLAASSSSLRLMPGSLKTALLLPALLGIAAPTPTPSDRSGPVRPAQTSGSAGSAVPAKWLLSTLGLDALNVRRAVARSDGTQVLRVSAAPRRDPIAFPKGGLETLQYHFKSDAFDLLLDSGGRILGIFSADNNMREYFDISPFYFDVPEYSDPNLTEKWKRFKTKLQADAAAIKAYKQSRYGAHADSIISTGYYSDKMPYVNVQIDSKGRYKARAINPSKGNFLSNRLFARDSEKQQILLPVFPTVYNPGSDLNESIDRAYMREVYRAPSEGQSALVAGPGSGVDSWLIWLKTRGKIHAAGINPLEIANLRASARIAGFEVEAKVHDNIISADGKPAFGRMKFDWIVWNGMLYTHYDDFDMSGIDMAHLWDGDPKGAGLRRFASGLPLLLAPNGRSIYWNAPLPEITYLLMSAGKSDQKEEAGAAKILDVEYRNWTYLVSRPAGGGAADHPSIPPFAFNALDAPSVGRVVRQLTREIRNQNSDVGKQLQSTRKEREDRTDFLKNLGTKARVRGPVVYYPFGGFDPYTPFSVVQDATDVFAMGKDDFGNIRDIREHLGPEGLINKIRAMQRNFYKAGPDGLVTPPWPVVISPSIQRPLLVGPVTIPEIVALLNGTVKGIHYFNIERDGSARFLEESEVSVGRSVVVEFVDSNGITKRYWYLQHDANQYDEGFRKFIDRLKFQTLFLKAPMDLLGSGNENRSNVVRDTLVPAKRNGARIISDRYKKMGPVRPDSQSAPHPIWKPDYSPEEIVIEGHEYFGYSGPAQKVYAGDADGLIDSGAPGSMAGLFAALKKIAPKLSADTYVRIVAPIVESGAFGILYLSAVMSAMAAAVGLGVDFESSIWSVLPALAGAIVLFSAMNLGFGLLHKRIFLFDRSTGRWYLAPWRARKAQKLKLAEAAMVFHIQFMIDAITVIALFTLPVGWGTILFLSSGLLAQSILIGIGMHWTYNWGAKTSGDPALALARRSDAARAGPVHAAPIHAADENETLPEGYKRIAVVLVSRGMAFGNLAAAETMTAALRRRYQNDPEARISLLVPLRVGTDDLADLQNRLGGGVYTYGSAGLEPGTEQDRITGDYPRGFDADVVIHLAYDDTESLKLGNMRREGGFLPEFSGTKLALHVPIYWLGLRINVDWDGRSWGGVQHRYVPSARLSNDGRASVNANWLLDPDLTLRSRAMDSMSPGDIASGREAIIKSIETFLHPAMRFDPGGNYPLTLSKAFSNPTWALAYTQDRSGLESYLSDLNYFAKVRGASITVFLVPGLKLGEHTIHAYYHWLVNEYSNVDLVLMDRTYENKMMIRDLLLYSGTLDPDRGLMAFPNLVTGNMSLSEALSARRLFIHDGYDTRHDAGLELERRLFSQDPSMRRFAGAYGTGFRWIANRFPEQMTRDFKAAADDFIGRNDVLKTLHGMIDESARHPPAGPRDGGAPDLPMAGKVLGDLEDRYEALAGIERERVREERDAIEKSIRLVRLAALFSSEDSAPHMGRDADVDSHALAKTLRYLSKSQAAAALPKLIEIYESQNSDTKPGANANADTQLTELDKNLQDFLVAAGLSGLGNRPAKGSAKNLPGADNVFALFGQLFPSYKIDRAAAGRFQNAVRSWIAAFKVIDSGRLASEPNHPQALVLDVTPGGLTEADANRLLRAWRNATENEDRGLRVYFAALRSNPDAAGLRAQLQSMLEKRGVPNAAQILAALEPEAYVSQKAKMSLEDIHRFVVGKSGANDVSVEVVTDDISRFDAFSRRNAAIRLYQMIGQTRLILVPALDDSFREIRLLSTQA